ncbi:MAG: hypothetical protein ABSD85_01120 [Acidimicrobiales bacterium]
MVTGPVVASPTALDLQREAMDRIGESDLLVITAGLQRKAASLRGLLSDDPSQLDRAELREVLRWVFATRRRADRIVDAVGPERLAGAIARLLDAGAPVAERIDLFDATLGGDGSIGELSGAGIDLPAELLHFTQPARYWLWTRWIWDPGAGTGALGLLTNCELERSPGATRGAVYMSVGRATAFAEETCRAAGFSVAGAGLFGMDVLMAVVYGVYMHTILQMRVTREFTRVIPSLPDIVRRLLGVQGPEA